MKNHIAKVDAVTPRVNATSSWNVTSLKKFAAVVLISFSALSVADAKTPDCVPGTLAEYQTLGAAGCVIGDKTFSNFQYHPAQGALSADAISITPGTVSETYEPGLLFEAKWTSDSQKSLVSYDVEVEPNGKPITGASLEMQSGQITGTGRVTVLADLCPEDSADGCAAQTLELKVDISADGAKKPLDEAQFKEPQKAIRVVTPVDLDPGPGGSASLEGFMAVFR